MRVPYRETIVNKQIKENRIDRKKRIQRDIDRYGGDILDSDELKQAYDQTHHLWSTVGEHSLRVAASSLMICYALKKLRITTSISEVVVGSLCHDLGILGRDEKFDTKRECSKEHPAESVKVARDIVPDLTDKSADIIERHMWPMGKKTKAPNSLESLIVSIADKHVAVKDLFKGSEINNTGVKNTFRSTMDTIRYLRK